VKLGGVHQLPPFSLAFLDPPYGQGLAERSLAAAHAGGWLIPGALAVVEEAASAPFTAPAGFDELERRSYADSALLLLRDNGGDAADCAGQPSRVLRNGVWASGTLRLLPPPPARH